MSRPARYYFAALIAVVTSMALLGSLLPRWAIEGRATRGPSTRMAEKVIAARSTVAAGDNCAFPMVAHSGFLWQPTATTDKMVDGLHAFVAGGDLDPCAATPTEDRIVSLVSTSSLGVIWADLDYPRPPSLVQLVVLGTDPAHERRWVVKSSAFVAARPDATANSSPVVAPPSWLVLPPGRYSGAAAPRTLDQPGDYLQWWMSATRDFVAGRVSVPLQQASGAFPVHLGGITGWGNELNATEGVTGAAGEHAGMVTVYAHLPGGGTFFFAGTDTREAVVALAARALPHFTSTASAQ